MFVNFVQWVMVLVLHGVLVSPYKDAENDDVECDFDSTLAPEGNLGETALFPWLGILKARLHGVDTFTEFITTIVMIKDGFALVIADDVARMPPFIFNLKVAPGTEKMRSNRGFVSVMFLVEPKKFWYCKLLDFITHPEYNEETMANTIAIVQLHLLQESFPVKPICLPYDLNADSLSNQLYAVMYDDENMRLEKAIHAMHYQDKATCQQFYKKRGFSQANLEPKQLQCAYAAHMPVTCVWDAGVALISNATGPWVLLGLGTKSLGCANPTRFIDIVPYILWIDTVTNLEPETSQDMLHYRRSGFDTGFGKDDITHSKEVSTQKTLYDVPKKLFPQEHEPESTGPGPSFTVKRVSQTEILYIGTTKTDWDYCDQFNNRVLYHGTEIIKAPNQGGRLDYQIILYNEKHLHETCTRIKLNATYPDTSVLYFNKLVQIEDGEYNNDEFPEETPKMIVPPPSQRGAEATRRSELADFNGLDPVVHISIAGDGPPIFTGEVHQIFLRLDFEYDAVVDVEVLTPHILMSATSPATSLSTRSLAKRKSDVLPLPRSRKRSYIPLRPMPYVVYDTVRPSTALALVSGADELRSSCMTTSFVFGLLVFLGRKH